jgi:hypothetical protein
LLSQVLQLSDNPFKDKKLPKVLKEGKLKPILIYIAKNGAPRIRRGGGSRGGRSSCSSGGCEAAGAAAQL